MARLLFMGIWNECDDLGSFEWSPLKLKMRILPADAADAAELLAELENAGSLLRYEIDGRAYGAVRNFCQYQRPKKPHSTYPQTDAVRNWVNTEARSTRDGEEPVGNQLPTSGEKPRQMKDGGGNKDIPLGKPNGDEPDQIFWDGAKAFIKPESGNPGALVGKWCRDFGKPQTAAAITQAQLDRPAVRIPYIEAILRKHNRAQPTVPL
jgi:hypothetical protein